MMIGRLTSLAAFALVMALAPLPAQGHIDLPVSLPELQQRVRVDSNDPAAHYNVALGYWKAKKWDDADRELRLAVKLQPRFAEAHLALAFLPFAADQHMLEPYRSGTLVASLPEKIQAALKQRSSEYRFAFVTDPMVDLRIIAANTTSPDYWEMRDFLGDVIAKYFGGLALCQQGQYADCENALTVVINELTRDDKKGDPVPANAYWYRGLAAAHVKHYDVAIADFGKLIARDQKAVAKAEEKGLIRSPMRTSEYRYFLAVFQQAAGRSDEAIATYRQAIEGDLGLYAAHVRMAEIYEGRKDMPKAIEERQYAVDANPDDPSLQMDLGVTLGRAGRFADAERALHAATDGLPRDPAAWFWLGVAEQQLGKKPEARVAFEQVVALAPSRLQSLAVQAGQHLAALQ